jgi:hypothetical protein
MNLFIDFCKNLPCAFAPHNIFSATEELGMAAMGKQLSKTQIITY